MTFIHSSLAVIVMALCLLYFVVFVARRLGPRSFEVCLLGSLAVFAALAGFQGPNQVSGVCGLLFIAYMIVIRDKLAAARKH
jgi:hypothetical protein